MRSRLRNEGKWEARKASNIPKKGESRKAYLHESDTHKSEPPTKQRKIDEEPMEIAAPEVQQHNDLLSFAMQEAFQVTISQTLTNFISGHTEQVQFLADCK